MDYMNTFLFLFYNRTKEEVGLSHISYICLRVLSRQIQFGIPFTLLEGLSDDKSITGRYITVQKYLERFLQDIVTITESDLK